jgi:peptide/nickel transport system substrate-binding protein
MRQDNYAWPKWGQYIETKGMNGDPIDMPEAKRLAELYSTWMSTSDKNVQEQVWRDMLRNHAENQWIIGTVAGALQPIVTRNGLEGLPAKALYSWEPTSMLGIHRVDELHWNKAVGKEARR